MSTMEIHPDVLAAKAAVYRACARATDASLVYALVAPFVSHAELLREILGNGRKTNDIADENLTALHVLASRANLNEERLSEENVLPLVKLLVLEYKATPLSCKHGQGKRCQFTSPQREDVQRY